MTIQEIYDLGIEMAIKADPRGESVVHRLQKLRKKTYEALSEKEKKYFDEESLRNPYSDSRILVGNPKLQVKKVLAGIDANATEVLLADRLNQKGEGIDLLISHHPEGAALSGLHEVMELLVDEYAELGVPVNVAHAYVTERQTEVARRFRPLNHNQAIDAARLLGIPLMALHTIWDNLGDHFVKEYVKKREFDTVGEIADYLNEIPELDATRHAKSGLEIVSGNKKSRPGQIYVEYTGGTNPQKELLVELAKAGVGTIITMHMKEDSIKEMQKQHVNVIDTGHMGPDSIGANIFLDVLEEKGIEVIPCSGIFRIKRKKAK